MALYQGVAGCKVRRFVLIGEKICANGRFEVRKIVLIGEKICADR
jgi:hypothetical protein